MQEIRTVDCRNGEDAGACARREWGDDTLIRPATWGPPPVPAGWTRLVGYVRVRWSDPLVHVYSQAER